MMGTAGRSHSQKAALYIAAGLIALIWLIPFLGVFMASIRPLSEINRGWWRFDSFTPTFKNYVGAWNHPAAPISKGMLNSLKVAIPATVVPVLVASIAAYGFARFKFRGERPSLHPCGGADDFAAADDSCTLVSNDEQGRGSRLLCGLDTGPLCLGNSVDPPSS